VSVEAATAIATVRAPWRAASRGGRPSSRFRNTLSSTTIESSTTRPTARARPPSDMTLNDSPKRYMMMKVASTDTGSDTPMMSVERRSRRNAKITRIASSPPCHAESTTSWIELSMKRDWSATVASRDSGGSWSLATRRRTARATDTVLASPSL